MAGVVYFEETLDHHIYVGYTDNLYKRRRQHAADGLKFLAALPGDGGGTGTAEKNIHAHFNACLVRAASVFSGEPIKQYVEWLVIRGYATTDLDSAEKIPRVPFEVWQPAQAGDPFIEPNGQEVLMDGLPNMRARVARASQFAWLQSRTDQWLTPPSVIELARKALNGHIDTDPASCVEANAWINATWWYSIGQNGLSRTLPWKGNVWLNPPYGTGEQSAKAFAARLVDELRLRNVKAAITCLNLNSASAKWFDLVWSEARVHLIWRGRIDFIPPGGKQDSSPSKGTILSYFGADPHLFAEVFHGHGQLLTAPPGDGGLDLAALACEYATAE
jgi:hypothetical protein